MKTDDPKLSAWLREFRVTPALPPRFQQNVWRRIEDAEAAAPAETWLDALAAGLLRPRLALASIAVLLLAGLLLGAHQGTHLARDAAQARYLAAVALVSQP